MITVSITRNASNANWSCRKMPIFVGRVTEPLVGSISPVKIFIKVDLPAPLGPDTAYRRPAMNVQVTSSNSTRGPNRMDMLFTESIAFNYTVESLLALSTLCLGTMSRCAGRWWWGAVFRHTKQSRTVVFTGSGENEKLEEISSRTFCSRCRRSNLRCRRDPPRFQRHPSSGPVPRKEATGIYRAFRFLRPESAGTAMMRIDSWNAMHSFTRWRVG